MYSPLYKTRHTLKILRWTCGFPLQTKDDSYTVFRFVTSIEIIRLIIVLLVLRTDYLYMIALFLIYDGSLSNVATFYEDAYNNFSASRTVQITMLIWQGFVIISLLASIIAFKRNAESISLYCKEVSAVKSEMNSHLVRKARRKDQKSCCAIEGPEKTIIYQQAINLTASVLTGIWVYHFFVATMNTKLTVNLGNSFTMVYPVLTAFLTFYLVFGPISCSVELIICQLINSLEGTFEEWIELLRFNSDTDQADSIPNNQDTSFKRVAIDALSSER